jgi:hypothetical protein
MFREGQKGGSMPYCEDPRPLPERCSYVSRYANARTLQLAVIAASFAGGVIVSPLLDANAICWHVFNVCHPS